MFNLSGFQTAMLLILAIAVFLLAVHLFAAKSKLGRMGDKAFNYIEPLARADWAKAQGFFATEADAIAAGWQKVVPTFESELLSLLTKVETSVLDTSGEDQDIADAQDAIKTANDRKAAKFSMGRAHLARVQAALDAKDPPAAA